MIGAIYLDGGLDAARRFVLSMTEHQIRAAVQNVDAKDYKTQLQEYVQKLHKGNVTYELLNTTGPDHQKVFYMRAVVAGDPMGTGQGGSKQEAGQAAARQTLEMLGDKSPNGVETKWERHGS